MKPQITMEVKGSVMRITPLSPIVKATMERVATFKKRVQVERGRYEYQIISLFEVGENSIETFSGLRERITTALTKAGFGITVNYLLDRKIDAATHLLTDEDIAELGNRPGQLEVVGAVVDSPDGFIVDAPTGWGKSHVISKLCKIMPKANIAVVAPGIDVVDMLYRRIKENVREVGIVGGGNNKVSRITVSTLESMPKLAKNDWHILLFDEVHRAGGEVTANNIASVFHTAKCIGFSASPEGRSDNSDLVVEALFGPVRHHIQYAEAESAGSVAPIRVKLIRLTEGPRLANYTLQVTKNRYGIWRNEQRNRIIAEVALQLPAEEQTLIMVATAEHALNLKKLLPDYQVVFSSVSNKTVLKNTDVKSIPGLDFKGKFDKKYRDYLRRQFEKGAIKKAIATSVWATGVDFTNLRNLIRGDGLASAIQAIQTPGRLSRVSDGKTHGVLIDFIDAFDDSMLRRSNTRKRSYIKSGWDVKIIEPGMLGTGCNWLFE